MLHEMVHGDLKALFHALTDRDRRHDYDKLRPPVSLIQLEHGLDINVGLAGTRFHFNIQAAPSQVLYQCGRLLDIIQQLKAADILEKAVIGQGDFIVFIPGKVLQRKLFFEFVPHERHLLRTRLGFQGTHITDIPKPRVITLTLKHLDDRFHRLGLIVLNLEIELHRALPPFLFFLSERGSRPPSIYCSICLIKLFLVSSARR